MLVFDSRSRQSIEMKNFIDSCFAKSLFVFIQLDDLQVIDFFFMLFSILCFKFFSSFFIFRRNVSIHDDMSND